MPFRLRLFLRQYAPGTDIGLALGVVLLLAVLVLPLPTMLLDLGLALSITASVLVLMVALFLQRPLDFTSFLRSAFPPKPDAAAYQQNRGKEKRQAIPGQRSHPPAGHECGQPPQPSHDPSIVESFIEVDYPRMLTEIAVGECFVLALYLTWGRAKGIRG